MGKRLLSGLVCAGLLLSLTACGADSVQEGPEGSAAGSLPPASAPALLTQADVVNLYQETQTENETFSVLDEIIPYGEDFLVLRRSQYNREEAVLDWVFASGRQQVLWSGYHPSYTILGPGAVQVECDGRSLAVPWQGMPERQTRVVLEGNPELYFSSREDIWLSLEQPWTVGNPIQEPRSSADDAGRYEQLYDARVGLAGLEFTFIPSGNSGERFESFFPASTCTPTVSAGFDPASRVFTLRLYNTCLSSGGVSDQEMSGFLGPDHPYTGLYPYTFPAGSLGGDGIWLSGAEVSQEGEDTLVTVTLSPEVLSYRIQPGELAGGSIPWLQVEFSDAASNWS